MFLDERGNVTLIVIIVVMSFGIILSIYPTVQQSHSDQTDLFNKRTAVLLVQENLRTLLNNKSAVNQTIGFQSAAGMPFHCIGNGTCNLPATGLAFDLYDGSGNVVLSSSLPSQGYGFNARTCVDFSTSNVPNCFFKVQLRWTPICGTPCVVATASQVNVTAVFIDKSNSTGFKLNMGQFSFAKVLQ